MDALVAAPRTAGVEDERLPAAITSLPRYGWQTALRAELARKVCTIERFADLAETARCLALHGRHGFS
jgi:protein-L-isoaspartate O-methyltransferase